MASSVVSLRLDPVARSAVEELAEVWQVYRRDGSVNRSETIRRAIVYAYLVYVKGVDPARASAELEDYIVRELTRLGLRAPRMRRRKMSIWD